MGLLETQENRNKVCVSESDSTHRANRVFTWVT